jgi:hypothetical protein
MILPYREVETYVEKMGRILEIYAFGFEGVGI